MHEFSATVFADLAAGDVDQDSRLDVAAVERVSAADITLGLGGGRCGAATSLQRPHPSRIVELADFVDDSRLDLIVQTESSNGLGVARDVDRGGLNDLVLATGWQDSDRVRILHRR